MMTKTIHIIAEQLTYIIINSFEYGIFPISLNNFAKIFENIMCNRLVVFFERFEVSNK